MMNLYSFRQPAGAQANQIQMRTEMVGKKSAEGFDFLFHDLPQSLSASIRDCFYLELNIFLFPYQAGTIGIGLPPGMQISILPSDYLAYCADVGGAASSSSSSGATS
jgi:hypothetical protein